VFPRKYSSTSCGYLASFQPVISTHFRLSDEFPGPRWKAAAGTPDKITDVERTRTASRRVNDSFYTARE